MTTVPVTVSTKPPGTLSSLWRRLRVLPWLTVMPLAALMAYANVFWMVSLRGDVGAIERTQEPFVTWLRESTLTLPLFVLAVVGALALAGRWFGATLRTPKTITATALLIVGAGTLVGIAMLCASSAYDYHLQANQLQLMNSIPGMASMPGMGTTAEQQEASLELQMRAVGYGSGLLVSTNLVLVAWVIAMRGGRLDVMATRK